MLLNNTMEETTNTMETSEDHSHQQMEAELTSLPIIDSSTRPSSVNNGGLHQHNNANIIEDLQVRNLFLCHNQQRSAFAKNTAVSSRTMSF